MAVRTAESLNEEARFAKSPEKEFLKQCALIVSQFDENYLRSQLTQIQDRIKSYQHVDKETLAYNGTSEEVGNTIKALKKKLKPFKTVLY